MSTADYPAERLFLGFVSEALGTPAELSASSAAVCVLANAAAVEALIHRYFVCLDRLPDFDHLKPMSKIEALAKIAGRTIDWGRAPWQEVARLIRVRNWLAHYKEARGEEVLVGIAGHRLSKFKPEEDISRKAIHSYYQATRDGFIELGRDLGLESSEFDFLQSEEYGPRL